MPSVRGCPPVVVRRVVAGQPTRQVVAGVRSAYDVDLVRLWWIERELREEAVRVADVQRAAVAVFGHHRLDAGAVQAGRELVLRRLVHGQRDVDERRLAMRPQRLRVTGEL